MKHGGWKIFSCVLERPPDSWVVGLGQCCFHSSCRAHAAMPIPYNNKHTHTHTCCGCIPQKDPPRYGAQQSVPLSLTSMHPLVHSRLTLGANINSPICRQGRRNSANLQSAEAQLLLADLHQSGKQGRNAGSAKSASARPELSKIGREDGAVVHASPSDIIKGRSGAENVTELSCSKFICQS